LRRGAQPGQERDAVVGEIPHEVSGEAEQLATLVGMEEKQSELHYGTHLVECEFELGDDPEVATSSPDGPEQVCVVSL
jgi:hypothetical protein